MNKIYTVILFTFFISEVSAQSVRVIDIVDGASGSAPSKMTSYKDKLYFTATGDGLGNSTGSPGYEPWTTDGTKDGSMMLKDLEAATGGAPSLFSPAKDYIFFSNDFTDTPWRSDGTGNGTIQLSNTLKVADQFPEFFQLGSWIIFQAHESNFAWELYRTDGTPSGTTLIKDINQDAGKASLYEPEMEIIGNNIFFTADDGTTGAELWKSDGTSSGTMLVRDIITAMDGTTPKGSRPSEFTNVNGTLYFRIDVGVTGVDRHELWKSNGTLAGTVLIKQFSQDAGFVIENFVYYKGILYFMSRGNSGAALWKSDGTETGTVIVKSFGNSASMVSSIEHNGTLYFGLEQPASGHELWKTDGTESGTVMVKDIYPGTESGIHGNGDFTIYDNLLYFNGVNADFGAELWKSDGTESGTVRVTDLNPGTGFGVIGHLETFNNELYFWGNSPENGDELFVLDAMVTSTSDQNKKSALKLYPNPSDGRSIMEVPYSGTINISHSNGSLIRSEKASSGQYQISDLKPGIYFVEFVGSRERKIEKLVVY